MPDYFVASDGFGEPTIWASGHTPIGDVAVLRKRDVPTALWPDVVARMTGTVVDREFLIRVDSYCSLVAARYARDLPADVRQELSHLSGKARAMYEPRRGAS